MTREDIIRMAREAGFKASVGKTDKDDKYHPDVNAIGRDVPVEWLERFATLVATAEREKVAAWMIQRGYATGHGDTTEDLLKELDWQIDERIAAEREACANVCEAEGLLWGQRYATAIRARGQA